MCQGIVLLEGTRMSVTLLRDAASQERKVPFRELLRIARTARR